MARPARKLNPPAEGIDHAFSFPLRYFDAHGLTHDWRVVLEDFVRHWPTDAEGVSVEDVRRGRIGNGPARFGDARWRRLAEETAGAKSPFHFDMPGSVAKSTHAGVPCLRWILRQAGRSIHCWPFDGWQPPPTRSVIAEVYPAPWNRSVPRAGRSQDQHDAHVIASCLKASETAGNLATWFEPSRSPTAQIRARTEGWILGLAACRKGR